MRRRTRETALRILLAVVFAVASLGHAATMRLQSADCHTAMAGKDALDGIHPIHILEAAVANAEVGSHQPAPEAPSSPGSSMLPGCPLASLPPLPLIATAGSQREAGCACFAAPAELWPESALLDRADPPPRFIS